MVGQIKTVNGVKKIVPLTAEARAGNPVSTVIAIYSNLVPYGYLPCNGVQFDETQFPALYAILGDNHTPDLRECALVGAGQNATDTIATHDVYDIGEFKDDCLQGHAHSINSASVNTSSPYNAYTIGAQTSTEGRTLSQDIVSFGSYGTVRPNNVTHGKQKGINYCIKATAGLDESDADYVLGVLAPVDEVALNNMHSVTSNAVAEAIEGYLIWENPDSSQDFAGQTITFDRAIPDRYSKVKIMYRNIVSEDYYFYTECVVGDRCYLNSSYITSNGVQWVTSRLFRNFTRTTVEIGTCQTYSSSSGNSTSLTRCVPVKIWAIK